MSGSLTNPNAVVTANDLSDFYQRIYPYLGGSGGSGGSGVPDGGTTGQILAKKSNVNGDVEWINNEVGSEIASELESLSTLMSELTSSVSSESTAQLQIDSTQNSSLSSLGAASSELGSEVAVLNSEVADKQDILTAGPGITISGNIISSTSGISFAVVDALPTTNISTSTIYLLPKLDTDTDDIYDEWGYINNTWEHLGNTKIDLSNYYNKTQIDSKFTSQSTIDSTQTRQISSLSQSASELASVVTSQSIAQSQLDSTQNIALGSLSTENSTQASEIESLSTETSEIISTFESQSTVQSEIDSTQNRSLNSLSAENSYHTSEIGSLSTTSSVLSSTVAVLGREVAAKQDNLTAGTGISIQNNVISVTGEGQGGGDVSSEVESLSTLMSELANVVSSEAVAQSEIDSTQNSYINSLTSENIVRRFEVSSLFTDTSELGSEVDIINSEVAVINSELAEKQNILTAGPGITISGTTISSTPRLEYAVVDALPVTDISTTILYLLPKLDTDTDDIYDEWAYINNAWEHIGNTKIDLTDYYNKTQIDSVFASQSNVDSVQTSQITSLSMSASETAKTVSSILSSQSMHQTYISSLSIENSMQSSEINSLSLLDHTPAINSLSVAESEIISAFESTSSVLSSTVDVLGREVAAKQDKLTAGTGVSIQNNVISVTGEGQGGGDVSSEVESLSSLMSELANTVSSESTAQLAIDSTQNNSLSSLSTASSELSSEVAVLGSELATKQDALTAGPGISISGTTISANARTSFEIVNTLPSTDISTTTIYLMPKSDTDTDDIYDEWAYINNAWEHLGNTKIDLTNYYNKTQIDNKFTSQSNVDSVQTSQITSLSMSASETAKTVSSILSSQSMHQTYISSLSIENSMQSSEINSLSLLDHTPAINSLSVAESELSSELDEFSSELDTKQNILAIADEEGTVVPNRSNMVFQEPLTVDDDSAAQKTMIGVDVTGELDMTAFVAPSHLSQGIDRIGVLSDVQITAPTDGQGLKYDATAQKWVNGDVGVSEIELLDDVAINNPTDGQILAYSTTTQKWTNKSDSTILTQTLAANTTEVTFTNIPTTGTNLFSLYTNMAGLEYLTVNDSVSGQLTYTFEKQLRSVTVYLVIKGV